MMRLANPHAEPKLLPFCRALLWLLPLGLLALLGTVVFQALHAEPPSGTPAAAVSRGAFPRTIREATGQSITIPTRPKRIVCADTGCADVLAALCEPGRIAALPDLAGQYSNEPAFFKKNAQIRHFENYNAETLLALKPDLVLAGSFSSSATDEELQAAHVPVLVCSSFRTFAGLREWLGTVGHAIGEDARAQSLQAAFDRRLRTVAEAVSNRPRPRVLAYTNYGQGFAIGTGESQDEIIRVAGGCNALAEWHLAGHVHFSFEQMLKLDPDVLLLTGEQGLDSPQVQALLHEPALATLRALKERRIAVVPDRLLFAMSHHVADAVELLARQLHPEAFASGDPR